MFQDAQNLVRGLWLIFGFESRRFEPGGVGDRVRGGLESCDAAGPRAATSIIRLLLYAAAACRRQPSTSPGADTAWPLYVSLLPWRPCW